MTKSSRRLVRPFCCLLGLALAAPLGFAADPARTTVSDTIYRADGTPASGALLLSWPAFITADGKPVAAGSMKVDIGAAGAINLALVPTQGATPSGSYYKVVLKLSDGATSTEYWSVPTLSPTTIAAIRSSVVPTSVAMQVVSREYVDTADAAGVHKTGDETIAGVKTFSASPLVPEPSAEAAAASKGYVDAAVITGGAGILGLNKGGTGNNTWTSARCVRVASDGTKLESAGSDCGSAAVDWANPGSIGSATPNSASFTSVTVRAQDVERHTAGFSGSDAGTRIAAAIADCPSSGCRVHADVSGSITTDIFSGVTKPVTLVFGASTFAFPAADVNIPANIALEFEQGAQWSVPAGRTVTVNASIRAGTRQNLFTGAGAVKLVGTNPIYVHWYGAVGDGATDDYAAIQAAISSNPGHVIRLPRRSLGYGGGGTGMTWDFFLSDGLVVSGNGTIIEGDTPASAGGGESTMVLVAESCRLGTFRGVTYSPCISKPVISLKPDCTGCGVRNISLDGRGKSGVHYWHQTDRTYYMLPVSMVGTTGGAVGLEPDGVLMAGGWQRLDNVSVWNMGRHGILIDGTSQSYPGSQPDYWVLDHILTGGCFGYGIVTLGGDSNGGSNYWSDNRLNQMGGVLDGAMLGENSWKFGSEGNTNQGVLPGGTKAADICKVARSAGVVTLTTCGVHTILVGDSVVVTNVPSSIDAGSFNGGPFIVTGAGASTLSYTQAGAAVATTQFPTAEWNAWVQVPGATIATTARSGNVSTITTTAAHGITGSTWATITGATQDAGNFNGTYWVTATNATTLTYAKTGSDVAAAADTGGVTRAASDEIYAQWEKTASGYAGLGGKWYPTGPIGCGPSTYSAIQAPYAESNQPAPRLGACVVVGGNLDLLDKGTGTYLKNGTIRTPGALGLVTAADSGTYLNLNSSMTDHSSPGKAVDAINFYDPLVSPYAVGTVQWFGFNNSGTFSVAAGNTSGIQALDFSYQGDTRLSANSGFDLKFNRTCVGCTVSFWNNLSQIASMDATGKLSVNGATATAAAGADLGSASLPWKDFYLAGSSGTPGTNNFKFTGASTGGLRTITLRDASGTMAYTTDTIAPVRGGLGTDVSTVLKGGMISGSGAGTFTLTGAGTDGDCWTANTTSPGGAHWAACGAGGGANTALSNLAAVAINTALIPASAAGSDFGSAALPWRDFYLAGSSGTPATNKFKLTGASTGGLRSITLPDASGTVALTANNLGVFAGGGTISPNKILTTGTDPGVELTDNAVNSVSGTGNARLVASGNKLNLSENGGLFYEVLSAAKGPDVITVTKRLGDGTKYPTTSATAPASQSMVEMDTAGKLVTGVTASLAKARPCEIHINGTSASGVIQAADGDFVNCVNKYGATVTVTSVTCFSDNAGTTTVQIASNAPSNLCTSAVTCSPSGAACTLNGTPTMIDGQWLTAPTITADGASKTLVIVIGRTL